MLCLLALFFVSVLSQAPVPAPSKPTCNCVLNYCACCADIAKSFPLVGDISLNTCAGVLLKLDENRLELLLKVNGRVIVSQNFTGVSADEPMCAPVAAGLSLCLQLTHPSVNLVRRVFTGCIEVSGRYLDSQIFTQALPCFEVPLQKPGSTTTHTVPASARLYDALLTRVEEIHH